MVMERQGAQQSIFKNELQDGGSTVVANVKAFGESNGGCADNSDNRRVIVMAYVTAIVLRVVAVLGSLLSLS